MSKMFGRREFGTILSIVTMGAALCFASGTVRAEDSVSDEQILQALTPAKKPPLTRGLSVGPQTPEADPTAVAAEAKFVQTIRGRATRSLSATEREQIATIAKTKPNIDLEITFNYNLAEISQNSLPSVQALGRALTNAAPKGSTFIVAGHTDAAGGNAYKQELSERRADSIKHDLVDKYAITASDLVTVGYGKSKLKDPSQPPAEINRRVQVVNMENKAAEAASPEAGASRSLAGRFVPELMSSR
jgi:outer membrane protein OmpA-like peptidoglycan-associated protein